MVNATERWIADEAIPGRTDTTAEVNVLACLQSWIEPADPGEDLSRDDKVAGTKPLDVLGNGSVRP